MLKVYYCSYYYIKAVKIVKVISHDINIIMANEPKTFCTVHLGFIVWRILDHTHSQTHTHTHTHTHAHKHTQG